MQIWTDKKFWRLPSQVRLTDYAPDFTGDRYFDEAQVQRIVLDVVPLPRGRVVVPYSASFALVSLIPTGTEKTGHSTELLIVLLQSGGITARYE